MRQGSSPATLDVRAPMSARRPHPKSRLGCTDCKRRRVKVRSEYFTAQLMLGGRNTRIPCTSLTHTNSVVKIGHAARAVRNEASNAALRFLILFFIPAFQQPKMHPTPGPRTMCSQHSYYRTTKLLFLKERCCTRVSSIPYCSIYRRGTDQG